MFKFVLISALLVGAFAYGPQKSYAPTPVHHGGEKYVAIVRQLSDIQPDGSYTWGYETEDGKAHEEQGHVKNAGQKEQSIDVQGTYHYTAPDGTPIEVQYVANENGFQPQGAHLPVAPTPPPIPAAIARALDYIASHPQQVEKTSYTAPQRRY